jgi:hypothetical protein
MREQWQVSATLNTSVVQTSIITQIDLILGKKKRLLYTINFFGVYFGKICHIAY